VQQAGEGDFLCAVADAVPQILMEAGVESLIGVAGVPPQTGPSAERGAYCPATRSGTPASPVIVELLEKSADADLLRETIGFAPEG
jgi:hypothetical protein